MNGAEDRRNRNRRWMWFARVAGVLVAAASALTLSSVPALAAPPALAGTWKDPGGVFWSLNQSPDRETLTCSWSDGAGHPGLRGTCNTQAMGDISYSGNITVTEGSVTAPGTILFRIVSADSLEVTTATNLAQNTFTLVPAA